MHFTDKRLERDEILEHFLHLILQSRLTWNDYTNEPSLGETIGSPMMNRLVDLTDFLHKWECAGPLRMYGLCVTEMLVRGEISAYDAFILGMLADDPELCISCLKIKGQLTSPLDVTVEFRIWQRVKPKYLWALACAGRAAKNAGTEGWSDISEFFRLHLIEADSQVHTG